MSWTPEQIAHFGSKYNLHPDASLYPGAENPYFPAQSFLRDGYAPIGGYVKDFGMLPYDGRWHLFHITGHPGVRCWVSGNEVAFGHASTSDFQHWIRHHLPLAVGDRSWERSHVWAPFVYPHQGRFYMFYMGAGPGECYISYAVSDNLETWTRWANGPIRSAHGRDPFVCEHEGKTLLLYTVSGRGAVGARLSTDMEHWETLDDLLTIPGQLAAESPSMHPCRGRYVLWVNDYGPKLAGFRAAYVFSDDPLQFDPAQLQTLRLETAHPAAVPSLELPVSVPTPLSIELLAAGDTVWFVSYFRWHQDRNRLFFGALDWSSEPAVIREILDPEHLARVLQQVGLTIPSDPLV